MQSAQRFRLSFFALFFVLLIAACKEKDISIDQKIIGTWKSTQTITQVYEGNQLINSYLLKSDQHSFSILVFDSKGHFKSSGQYAASETDSLSVTILSPQQGNYRVTDHKLFTKLAQLDKEAELELTFKGHNKLTLVTRAITSLNSAKSTKNFISNTTYIRVR